MFAHPVGGDVLAEVDVNFGLGEARFSKNFIMDEISENNEVGVIIPSENISNSMFFGVGWNIVKNMVIQDI